MKKQTRHEIFLKLIALLAKNNSDQLKAIAEEAGISSMTLYNWIFGDTMNPHLNTIMRVAEAMGYEITLQKVKPNLRKVA